MGTSAGVLTVKRHLTFCGDILNGVGDVIAGVAVTAVVEDVAELDAVLGSLSTA